MAVDQPAELSPRSEHLARAMRDSAESIVQVSDVWSSLGAELAVLARDALTADAHRFDASVAEADAAIAEWRAFAEEVKAKT